MLHTSFSRCIRKTANALISLRINNDEEKPEIVEFPTKNFDKDTYPVKEDYQVFEDYLAKLKAEGKLQKGVAKSFLDCIARERGVSSSNAFFENVVLQRAIEIPLNVGAVFIVVAHVLEQFE